MSRPNFLIIGAAKAGTTSLFYYLRQHPRIFTALKEPNFLGWDPEQNNAGLGPGRGPGDDVASTWTTSLKDYEALFAPKPADALAGEASVTTLYSPIGAERVQAIVPDAKLVVVLRHPVERAWSQYLHHVRDAREPLSFAEALAAEDERIAAGWDFGWHYRAVGRYGEQLEPFYERFPAAQIKVFLYEDLQQNSQAVLGDTLRFLGLELSPAIDTRTVHNRSGAVRSPLFAKLLNRPSRLRKAVKRFLPSAFAHRVMDAVRRVNLKDDKPRLEPALYNQLLEHYRNDIALTERLIGRDLSPWLTPKT